MGHDDTERSEDVALILGTDEERKAIKVLRKRGGKVEGGLVRAAEPGRPVMGDLVRLKPRPEFPILCDVETLYEFDRASHGPSTHPLPPPADAEAPRSGATGHPGPPRVVTDAYRRGWERVFGRQDPDGDPDVN